MFFAQKLEIETSGNFPRKPERLKQILKIGGKLPSVQIIKIA